MFKMEGRGGLGKWRGAFRFSLSLSSEPAERQLFTLDQPVVGGGGQVSAGKPRRFVNELETTY
jgi:hypothetical protein